jgi:poly(3-hydroxybutyrate) depolymerase
LVWHFKTAILAAALLIKLGDVGLADHDVVPDPAHQSTEQALPGTLDISSASVTVSGLSSGAFFAHQFHVAYSNRISGAGIVAGGPYGCVDIVDNPFWPFARLDRLSAALVACTHYLGSRYWGLRPNPPEAADAVDLIQTAYRSGEIDDPQNLADDRVWLFRGSQDDVVPAAVGQSLAELYQILGIDSEALKVMNDDPALAASHGMPVESGFDSRFPTRSCGEHLPPFIIQCSFSAAQLMLDYLYADVPPVEPVDAHQNGELREFDQSPFFDESSMSSMSSVGYIYVPTTCLSQECRLHIAFHGCRQNVDAQGDERIHDDFIRDAGYNSWAAANRAVVVYPQVTQTSANPNACWDFWGYSGTGWRSREGPQMRAVDAMISHLLGE